MTKPEHVALISGIRDAIKRIDELLVEVRAKKAELEAEAARKAPVRAVRKMGRAEAREWIVSQLGAEPQVLGVVALAKVLGVKRDRIYSGLNSMSLNIKYHYRTSGGRSPFGFYLEDVIAYLMTDPAEFEAHGWRADAERSMKAKKARERG